MSLVIRHSRCGRCTAEAFALFGYDAAEHRVQCGECGAGARFHPEVGRFYPLETIRHRSGCATGAKVPTETAFQAVVKHFAGCKA